MAKDKELVFIRADKDKTSSVGVAWYRLDGKFRDFLNLCIEKHGGIDAVILSKDENGEIDFNIGFSLESEDKNAPVRTLNFCEICSQMTNHEKGVCLKCKK